MQQGKQQKMRFMWYHIKVAQIKDWWNERIHELWPWRYRYHMNQLRKFMQSDE